jgi:hypothetical protein
MTAPVDDFDLDIRLGVMNTSFDEPDQLPKAFTAGRSDCPTACISRCTTNCILSDCICQ